MRTHTSEFKEELKVFGRQIKGKITYYPSYDLVSESDDNILTEADLQIISEQANYDEPIEIDTEDIFSISIIKNGDLLQSLMKEFDFESKIELNIGSVVNPQFGLLVNGDYEYLNYGNYIINSKEFNMDTETWSYVCYDKMLFSMIKYRGLSNVQYPITIKQFINNLCNKVGLEFEDSEFVNQDQLIYEDLYKNRDVTYRDIFDEISKIVAGNLLINDSDKLEVGYPNKIGYSGNASGSNISIEAVEEPILDVKLEGDTQQEGTPTPDTPIPIKVVAGDNSIVITGKNLFDKNTVVNNYRLGSAGDLYRDNNYSTSDYIKVNYSTNYVFNKFDGSEAIAQYDENKTFIKRDMGRKFKNITTTSNTAYVRIAIYNSNLSIFQLEQGSTATEYVPYQEQTYPISLGSIELAKIDNYQDYIYGTPNNWYKYKYIQKIVFDGTEAWAKLVENTNTVQFIVKSGIPKKARGLYNVMSDLFKTYSGSVEEECITGQSNAQGIQIIINKTIANTKEDFKTWLSTHNVTAYYQLNTPTTEQITDTTLIEQLNNLKNATLYNGINNISVDGDLPIILNLDYISEYESINEDYLKDTNVRMSEKIGVINSVAILDSDNNLQYIAEDTQSIKENEMTRVTITNNLIAMNGETQEIADNILNKLNGLYYYANDLQTTGVCYYDFLDMFNVEARGNTYQCLLLNNEITITQGIEEHIFTERFEEVETNKNEYTTSVISNKEVQFKINQQEGKIESKVEKNGVISAINQSAEEIQINANRLNFEGKTINLTGDNVKIKGDKLDIDSKGQITLFDDSAEKAFSDEDPDMAYIIQSTFNDEYQGQNNYLRFGNKIFANGRKNEYENNNEIQQSTGYGHYFGGIEESLYRYPMQRLYFHSEDYDQIQQTGFLQELNLSVNMLYFLNYNGSSQLQPIILNGSTGNIRCVSLTQTSKVEDKKNFERLTNAKDILNQVDIYKYNFKDEEDDVKKSIGFVIGDDFNYSQEITSENNDGANIYSMVSVLWQVVKEQQEEIKELKEMIKNGKY